MRRLPALLAAVLTLALSAPLFGAEEAAKTDMNILRDAIRANKKALISSNLTLTDEEAAHFWPVYDRYQAELTAVNDRVLAILEDFAANLANLSNEKAKELADRYLAAEEDRAKVRRASLAEVAKVLPGRKVARFYQIENKMDAVLRYDLAAEIPVVME